VREWDRREHGELAPAFAVEHETRAGGDALVAIGGEGNDHLTA